MAGIVFKCIHCKHSISSDDSLCGEIAQCPECDKEVIIPIPGVEEGSVFGDFKLIERLGSGASGEVWLAHQQSMDRNVALKVLCPKLSSDKNFIDRFVKEAKNSAKLAHPNIVTAFFAGQDKGIHYLAISYVNGETIESKLEGDNVFDEKEALTIIKEISSALQYAWDEFKILHRDIKPANIIINKRGTPMLLDLGISKSLNEEDYSLTLTGTVVGTPYYMSPEQAMADKDLDFRSDIYSLGITFYHMLTGTVPYQASTAMAIIMKHLNEEFQSPLDFNSKISPSCLKLIEILMAKKKEERPQSWDALIKDINLVLNGKDPETPLPSSGSALQNGKSEKSIKTTKKTGKLKNWKSRFGMLKIIAIVFVLGIVAGAIFFFLPKDSKTNPAQEELIPEGITKPIIKDKTDIGPQSPVSDQEKIKETVSENQNASQKTGLNKNSGTITNPPAPEGSFQSVADKLDYTKNTSLAVKRNWGEIDNKEFTWTGKVVNVKGGWFNAEVHVACDNRPLYRGFNAILVTPEKEKVAKFKVGETVKFTGMVYNYKPKRDGLVIMYMSGVKFLSDSEEVVIEETDETP